MANKVAHIVVRKVSDPPRGKERTPWFLGFKTEGGQPHTGRRWYSTRDKAMKEAKKLSDKFRSAGYAVDFNKGSDPKELVK